MSQKKGEEKRSIFSCFSFFPSLEKTKQELTFHFRVQKLRRGEGRGGRGKGAPAVAVVVVVAEVFGVVGVGRSMLVDRSLFFFVFLCVYNCSLV